MTKKGDLEDGLQRTTLSVFKRQQRIEHPINRLYAFYGDAHNAAAPQRG